jgi:putative toxin-antitoxin system antitoxin component (TIGR02293 family)
MYNYTQKMKNTKNNIVTSISKRTGSPEDVIEKIITEFGRVLKQATNENKTTIIPDLGYISITSAKPMKGSKVTRNVPHAKKWHLVEIKSIEAQKSSLDEAQILSYCLSTRRNIIDELQSNIGSGEIIERFIKISSMPNKLLAEKVFEISPKTLYTYRHSSKTLPIRINEQILKLEELYKKGNELFENSEQFNKWLKSESYGLGNKKPIELINSITGIDLVYEELIRIEFGATA